MKNPAFSYTAFIADLHLQESEPHLTQLFLLFLKECVDKKVAALYILGDLFEAWIGDDDKSDYIQTIIRALAAAHAAHLPIYFIKGNRDFLIGKRFLRKARCQLLADESVISLYGEAALLLHGDTLCTADVHYLKWRKIARNAILNNLLFLMWPLALRQFLAKKMRAKSTQHTKNLSYSVMDVTESAVAAALEKHEVQLLIHGHTHKPCIHELAGAKKRIVLGAWHQEGQALLCDSGGGKVLRQFNQQNMHTLFTAGRD